MRRGCILVVTVSLCAVPGWTGAGLCDASPNHGAVATMADTALARVYFERFKELAGQWEARSTRGWEETSTWEVIAGGSVIMETSFDAHPGEAMVTLFALDRGRLVLDHYCVAGNQPHLVATKFAPDGSEVTFTFERGGNLESRDQGHMDKAVFRFVGEDRFTSQWTWYAKGLERWMEQIEARRATGR